MPTSVLDGDQERGHVEAGVLGCVGGEPAGGLFQLAFAADAPAATGLVPGDRDVDEPLKEVALRRFRAPPGVLERLVRGEPLAGPEQLDATAVVRVSRGRRRRGSLSSTVTSSCMPSSSTGQRPPGARQPGRATATSSGTGIRETLADALFPRFRRCYAPRAVATILVAGVDLFFRAKLDVLLGSKHKLVMTDSVHAPDLVIVDIARVKPDEVADAYPDVPILGFTNHTDTAGLRAGQAAGFDRVVVRSALAERAPQLVDELVG